MYNCEIINYLTMKKIKNIICDIISTIMPNEEEIKIFKQRSDDVKIADMLLDLLVSNLIFKIFVLKNSDCRDDCKGQCGAVIDEIKKICDNKELNHEWLTLSRLHIFYQLETMEKLNPSVRKYLHFETQKLGKELSEEEIWEQGDNEELIFSFLDTAVSDETLLKKEETSLRLLLESVLCLNLHIAEEARFQDLIRDNEAMLKGQLALENY